jgi:hypothetical protein
VLSVEHGNAAASVSIIEQTSDQPTFADGHWPKRGCRTPRH